MHWFDRLSERSTRREAFKATALAGAALAVPLGRAAPARADSSGKCRKGCNWTADQKYDSAYNVCGTHAITATFSSAYVGGAFGALTAIYNELVCVDQANLHQKLDYWNCKASDTCGGFDPTKPGGPCDSCTENCCTCQGTNTGYICCFYPCDGPTTCCPSG